MQALAPTKNRLAATFRPLVHEPLEITRYPLVHTATCGISIEGAKRMPVRGKNHREHVAAGLHYEHPLPLTSVLYPALVKVIDDTDAARELLVKYLRPIWITVDENKMLSAAGLRSKMPARWKIGDDVFARYRAVGIEIANA